MAELKEMYKGIVNSPKAELLESVNATDTIIKVNNIEAFPEAPNIATIGSDETAETILYAAKTADSLSGCTRGLQGIAKNWEAGEVIARNFTQKDHADLIENIIILQEKLSLKENQLYALSQTLLAIAEGTTQVGNSKTLDGHEASYFVKQEEFEETQINAMDASAKVINHSRKLINTENGVHGIRFFEGKTQYYDTEQEEWFDAVVDFLPTTGGTITGDLQIDGTVTLGGKYAKTLFTITTTDWTDVTGDYPKRKQINITGLLATERVDIDIAKESMKVAEKAGICPTLEEYEGYILIYAKKVPTANISATYKVVV